MLLWEFLFHRVSVRVGKMTGEKNVATTKIELVIDQSNPDQANLLTAIDDFAAARALSQTLRYRLGLIVDELVTNCIVHGACLGRGNGIRVTVEDREDELIVEIVDSGQTFDPTATSLPQCPRTGQVAVGGVGLSLVRRFAEWAHYNRSDNRNHLRLSLNKNEKTPHAS
jgi:anti-sigma regulatory factor (Ser/Thr protein kinase)